MRQKYKTEKDKSRRSGNGANTRAWKHFRSIDEILGERQVVNAAHILDSMKTSDERTSQESHVKTPENGDSHNGTFSLLVDM